MLEFRLDERKKQLLKLSDFTKNINQEIANITSTLGWTVESISNDNTNFLTCPYDPSHRITEACLETHLPACQWKAEGYQKLDIPFPESALPPNNSSSLQFDEELQEEVLRQAKEQNPEMKTGSDQRLIPRTSDRLISDFTSDERKALYEYVIAHTVKPDMGHDIADINRPKPQDKDNKEMSYLEMLILERNLKRRRAKHRGVHTNKKSHIEIIREVINQQMEIYTEYILEQKDADITRTAYSSERNSNTYSEKQKLIATNHYEKPSVSTHFSPNDKNGHHHTNTIYNRRQDNIIDKNDSESIKYQEYKNRLSDSKETKKDKRSEHRHRSRSRDYKSHKKHKHKSKDKHIKKKHKSRNHDRPSHEEGHSKYSDFTKKDSYYTKNR
ncbi:PREDICTED: U11/U12 small nuclear ribonucleoprotein 48 kDa protein-like [Polistes canadensis]|uniref:U11/U12 small nuclear ribonucleoprotein 48 kDa protein-like n=1 Tax=Polistes canadensis TaxID=91411 RepID=UPI000718F852|nr:PREDICTED: U11/U12 small nuclear ribonucleoprotein 48 kDa protein-like [Polistes canadensis]